MGETTQTTSDLDNPQNQETTPVSTSPQTPQTQNQQDPRTNPNFVTLLEQINAQNHAEIERLRAENARLAEVHQPQQAPEPSEDRSRRFFADPEASTRSIVQEALDKSIKPLYEIVQGLNFDGSPRQRAMNRVKQAPLFQGRVTPEIEAAANAILSNTPGVEINEQNVASAVMQAFALQHLNTPAPVVQQPNNPSPPTNVIPPTVRPTPPTPPTRQEPQTSRRPLNELEKRMAREYKMSEEEYLQWLDEASSNVATSQIGKKQGGQ